MARKKIPPPNVKGLTPFFKAFDELAHLINLKGGVALGRSREVVPLLGTLATEYNDAINRAKRAELSDEELETIRRIASSVEALKTIAEHGHEIHIGDLTTFIEDTDRQAWDLYWELWRRQTRSEGAASKAAQGGA